MSSESGILYVGVTNNLMIRVQQHKSKTIEGFTKRYNVTRLVYHAEFGDVNAAIAAEKRIKGWTRSKKIALIEEMNPNWRDLSADLLAE